MRCLDHVRIDIKTDAAGALRIMEVNGIPGLKPHKSWGPQLYTLQHRNASGDVGVSRSTCCTNSERSGSLRRTCA